MIFIITDKNIIFDWNKIIQQQQEQHLIYFYAFYNIHTYIVLDINIKKQQSMSQQKYTLKQYIKIYRAQKDYNIINKDSLVDQNGANKHNLNVKESVIAKTNISQSENQFKTKIEDLKAYVLPKINDAHQRVAIVTMIDTLNRLYVQNQQKNTNAYSYSTRHSSYHPSVNKMSESVYNGLPKTNNGKNIQKYEQQSLVFVQPVQQQSIYINANSGRYNTILGKLNDKNKKQDKY